MSEKRPQTLANHGRIDPLFHYFILPVLLICFIASIVFLFHRINPSRIWMVVISFTTIMLAITCRMYAAKVQDRIIRLEERLRLAALLPDSLRARAGELTEKQLVALRFAADEEVPSLVEKILREKLDPKAIKHAINNWRPDYWRV